MIDQSQEPSPQGNGAPTETFLQRYGEPVLRRWPVVLTITVVTALLTLVWAAKDAQPQWTATAAVTSQSETRSPDQDAVLALGYADYFNKPSYQQLLRTEAHIPGGVTLDAKPGAASPIFYIEAVAASPDVARSAAAAAADTFRADIRASLVAERSRQTDELQKQVDDLVTQLQKPGTTAAQGNVILDQIRSLQGRITDIASDATNALKQLQPEPGVADSRPSTMVELVIGVVGGLALGILVALVLGLVDDRVRRRPELERLGLPVLADLPAPRADEPGRARALERVANAIGAERPDGRGCTVAVVGVHRTAAAPRLAHDVTRLLGARRGGALLVHADLRAEAEHDGRVGLVDVLDGTARLRAATRVDDAGVQELPVGEPGEHEPYEIFTPERIAKATTEAAAVAGFAVLDIAPLAEAPESQLIAGAVDQVVLVVERGVTRRRALVEARDLLREAGATTVRVVLDRAGAVEEAPAPVEEEQPAAAAAVAADQPVNGATVPVPGHGETPVGADAAGSTGR